MHRFPRNSDLPLFRRCAKWLLARAPATACLLALTVARSSNAAWQPDGVPLSPLPAYGQAYELSGLAADGSGGAYVLWRLQELIPDDTRYTFAAQRVDAAGNRPAPWMANGSTIRSWLMNSQSGTTHIETVGLFEDGSGGAIAAVLDYVFNVEYQHLFRLYSIAPGGATAPIDITNSSLGGYPVVQVDADRDGSGGAVMIGLQETFAPPPNPPPPQPLFAQRVGAAGQPLWPQDPGTLGVQLNPVGTTQLPGVATRSDGAGGGFFAWVDQRPGAGGVYAQHLDAAGARAPGWPDGGVLVRGAAGGQARPHLARAAAGGVIVLWADTRSGQPRLYGAVVLADGTLAPGIPADGRQVPSSDVYGDALVNLASDGQGGCLVVREGMGTLTRLHRLDSALLPRPGWPAEGIALNTLYADNHLCGLVPDGLGGTFVSFRNGSGSVPPEGLFAQHFAANGGFAPGWGPTGHRLSGTGMGSAMVRSGSGAIVAWDDQRVPYFGVYAQRLVPDGPVATQMALARSAATSRSVSLRWYSADGPALQAALERNAGGSGWVALAAVTADGTGSLEYEDTAVTPGTRYGYRVVWRDGAVTRTGGETWIIVPLDLALALDAPSPNPSSGAVMLAVTLPDARAARLDVFDLAGRRIAGRDLAGLGAGRHIVALSEARRLAPGLYVVQLTQADATRRVRLVRVK